MSKKELSGEELEKELEKALKENQPKPDKCGEPIPTNREIGIQRSNVKLKDK